MAIKVAPYSFMTARELVSKSRDGASFKKSARKSRAIKGTEMSTSTASSFEHTSQWASDTHARVAVSKLYRVTNMETKKTRAHFSRVSFGEII